MKRHFAGALLVSGVVLSGCAHMGGTTGRGVHRPRDLLHGDTRLSDWIRTPLAATKNGLIAAPLAMPSPWKLDPTTGILSADGQHANHEFLRYRIEQRNFVLHVEFRFPASVANTYNGGVMMRTSVEGNTWVQAQTTAPGGFLMMRTITNGTPSTMRRDAQMRENRMKPPGEWNAYDMRLVGKKITLSVNGDVVDVFDGVETPSGYIGLESEGYPVEYRNVYLDPLR